MKNTINKDTAKRHENKYQNTNIFHQFFLGRFLDSLASELKAFEQIKTLDFGCGEAFFWQQMNQRGVQMSCLTGIDLRKEALTTAKNNFPQHEFICEDILKWKTERRFDLILAIQVLEHLPDKKVYLSRLLELTKKDED